MGWFAPSQRGLALGIRQTGVPLGGAFAALVLPVCLSLSGLRAALAVLAGALLVAAAAGASGCAIPARPPDPGVSERPPLADPRIWQLCWASGLLYVALGSLIGFAVLFLHSERGVSTQVAAAMLALVQVIGAALRLVAGRWSDRVGTRLGPLRRLGLALAAASAVVAVLVSAPLVVLVPAIVVAGSLSQSWNGLSFTAAAELAGYARSGAALGLQQTSLSLSSVMHTGRLRGDRGGDVVGRGFAVAAAAALAGTVSLRGSGGEVKTVPGTHFSALLVEPADPPGVGQDVALRKRVGRVDDELRDARDPGAPADRRHDRRPVAHRRLARRSGRRRSSRSPRRASSRRPPSSARGRGARPSGLRAPSRSPSGRAAPATPRPRFG